MAEVSMVYGIGCYISITKEKTKGLGSKDQSLTASVKKKTSM